MHGIFFSNQKLNYHWKSRGYHQISLILDSNKSCKALLSPHTEKNNFLHSSFWDHPEMRRTYAQ